jgi:hypothetical protein
VVHTKLIKSYNCPVDFIEKISDISVDVKCLNDEYESINKNLFSVSAIQDKFGIMQGCVWNECINNMSYTKSTIESLQSIFPYNSVYYRIVKPNMCYNWHIDSMKTCLHIPLLTNEGCKFVYEDRVFSMPADGSVYMVNNGIYHTFINAGITPRLHITMDLF